MIELFLAPFGLGCVFFGIALTMFFVDKDDGVITWYPYAVGFCSVALIVISLIVKFL